MSKLRYDSPEMIQEQLSEAQILWLVSANAETGILPRTAGGALICECHILGLVHPSGAPNEWELSADGWLVKRVMLRQ